MTSDSEKDLERIIDLKKAVPHPVDPNCAVFPPVMEGQGKPYASLLSELYSYTVSGNYPVTALKEFRVDVAGSEFLVIYGNHINGGFCCIPNWYFGCEMGPPEDTFFNTDMLSRRFHPHIAKAIAYGIRDACSGEASEHNCD